jgi:hypothetical protein
MDVGRDDRGYVRCGGTGGPRPVRARLTPKRLGTVLALTSWHRWDRRGDPCECARGDLFLRVGARVPT